MSTCWFAERADGPGADHILCCICAGPIHLDDYRSARCWSDPHGVTCAAHVQCLVRAGETDLGLPAA